MQRKKLWQKKNKEKLKIRETSSQNEKNKEVDNETATTYKNHISIKINLNFVNRQDLGEQLYMIFAE